MLFDRRQGGAACPRLAAGDEPGRPAPLKETTGGDRPPGVKPAIRSGANPIGARQPAGDRRSRTAAGHETRIGTEPIRASAST